MKFHPVAYTAPELAAAEHEPVGRVVKVVMAVAAGPLVMLVLPSTHPMDGERVAEALGTEEEFDPVFADCEPGGMPPFGNLYGVPVYVDAALAQEDTIGFPAGTHRETMAVKLADFALLVAPRLTVLGYHAT